LKTLINRQVVTVLVIAAMVVLADEAVALIIRAAMPQPYSIWLFKPFIILTRAEHLFPLSAGGIAYFLVADLFGPLALLLVTRTKAQVLLLNPMVRIGLGLLTGGGLVNGAERITRGSVTNTFVFGIFPDTWTPHMTVDFYDLADFATYIGDAVLVIGILWTAAKLLRKRDAMKDGRAVAGRTGR
jgi:lipoprotein signal peptidase